MIAHVLTIRRRYSNMIAPTGNDFLAVDVVGSEMMGADPGIVGYLWYLMQLDGFRRDDVRVVGEDPSTCVTKYKGYQAFMILEGG